MGECELDRCDVPRSSHPIQDSKGMNISGNSVKIFPHLFPDGAFFIGSKTQLVVNNVPRDRQSIDSLLCLVHVIRCVFWDRMLLICHLLESLIHMRLISLWQIRFSQMWYFVIWIKHVCIFLMQSLWKCGWPVFCSLRNLISSRKEWLWLQYIIF